MTITALDRMLEISELFQRDMERAFTGTSLTPARVRVLWVLHHGGSTTQQSLSAQLDVTPRNVSGLIDALEASGHVRRGPHPADRRATLVELTPMSVELMTEMANAHTNLNSTLLSAVDPADRAAFERGIEVVARQLRGLVIDAEAQPTHASGTAS